MTHIPVFCRTNNCMTNSFENAKSFVMDYRRDVQNLLCSEFLGALYVCVRKYLPLIS